jgi:alpha-D-xyloside xylohydrolase
VDALRFFNRLKTHLMPNLLDASREAHEHGWPMLRAMALAFPDDPAGRYLDMQYMLGPALLVAPIFDSEGKVSYYLTLRSCPFFPSPTPPRCARRG